MVSSGNIQYDINMLDYVISGKEGNSSVYNIPPVNHGDDNKLSNAFVRVREKHE